MPESASEGKGPFGSRFRNFAYRAAQDSAGGVDSQSKVLGPDGIGFSRRARQPYPSNTAEGAEIALLGSGYARNSSKFLQLWVFLEELFADFLPIKPRCRPEIVFRASDIHAVRAFDPYQRRVRITEYVFAVLGVTPAGGTVIAWKNALARVTLGADKDLTPRVIDRTDDLR